MRMNELGKTATTVREKDGVLSVVYHQTEVVKFDRNTSILTLDTDWHFTATTKARMNQASNQFDLGYRVYQKDFNWFVSFAKDDKMVTRKWPAGPSIIIQM